MKDIILIALMVVGFAWLFTVHVTIAFGLALRPPRWRALVGFLVPPLAPYWAWRSGMPKRAWLWVAGVIVYLAGLLLGSI